MKSIFFLLILCAGVVLCAHGQGQSDPATDFVNRMMPKPIPSSPNVAALGKYGDYGVSYFTGIPDISIPIYEIKSGSLSIPVTLNYHAAGIKQTDVASWVGANWSLSAGGAISRTVLGKADEDTYYNATINPSPSEETSFYYLANAALGAVDTESDIFSYSLPSLSGHFTLKNGSSPSLIPNAPIVIKETYLSQQFSKFELTDQNGVLYRFGQDSQGNTSTEYTNSFNAASPTLTAITGWHLMEMFAANSSDKITFGYQNVGTAHYSDISYSYVIKDDCFWESGSSDPGAPSQCPTDPPQLQPVLSNTSDVVQNDVQYINFENGMLEFVLSAGYRSDQLQLKYLDQIKVWSVVNGVPQTVIKTIKFIYSYYSAPSSGLSYGPLKLDYVQFKDANNNLIEQYGLKYKTNSFSWTANKNARDLWGYYNGANQNTDLLLPQTVPYNPDGSTPTSVSFGGAVDRKTNPQYITEGILSEIDFPTGGNTKFYFEPHKFLDVTQGNLPTYAGGLRVYQIVSSDGTSAPPTVKTYKYGDNESGYGYPNFSLSQFNYMSDEEVRTYECIEGGDAGNILIYDIRSYFSYPALALDPFDGSPVNYTVVTEYLGDPSTGITLGKTVYEYDQKLPYIDVPEYIPHSGRSYKNSSSFKRGKLTHKTAYDNLGNKLNESMITYTLTNSAEVSVGTGAYSWVTPYSDALCHTHVVRMLYTENEYGAIVYMNQFYWTNLSQSTGVMLPTQQTTYEYKSGDVNNFLMKQISFTYDLSKLQVTQSVETHSNVNEQEVTINRYPFQLNAAQYGYPAVVALYNLNQKNILKPFETYTYLQNADGSNQRIVAANLTKYRMNENNSNQVVADQMYWWESSQPLLRSAYAPAIIDGNGLTIDPNLKPRITFTSYDSDGNLLTSSKTNGMSTSYIYGYNNKLPIAEIENVQNSQIHASTTTGVVPIAIGPANSTITQTYNFTVDYTGPVSLKLGVSGNPSYATTASWSGIASGSITLSKNGCGYVLFTLPNVSRGVYSITLIISSTNVGFGACGEIDYPRNNSTSEVFFENFEDYAASQVSSNALLSHTGNNYFSGDYTANFTMPNSRSYKIEYWYYSAGTWNYITKPYSGTSMLLSEGTAIDDVRIYPVDAQMKTYAYNPILGMTSATDQTGVTQRYEYDSFGRLKLIRDDLGKIVKHYQYHYKNN